MKPFKILLKSLLFCLLLLPDMPSMAQVVQPDTVAVDTTGGVRIFLNNPNLTKLFFRNTSYNGTFNNLEKIIEIFVVH